MSISDADALDRIAEAVRPFDGEWSDMSGIIERVCDIVEATGREVPDANDEDAPDKCQRCDGAGYIVERCNLPPSARFDPDAGECEDCKGLGVVL